MSVSGFSKVKKHTDTLKGTERTSYHHRCFVVPRDPFSYRGHHQVIYLWDTHISYYWSSFVFVSARHPTEGCWSCSGQAETDPDFILHLSDLRGRRLCCSLNTVLTASLHLVSLMENFGFFPVIWAGIFYMIPALQLNHAPSYLEIKEAY